MGARKLRLQVLHSYAGLIETKIFHEVNIKWKYRKFNAKFTNKVIPHPVKVNNVMSQMQIDLVSMQSQTVEYEGKTYRYILSLMDIFSRFHWLAPLQRKLSSQVASKLDRIFVEHVPAERLQSGNCGEFKKEVTTKHENLIRCELSSGKVSLKRAMMGNLESLVEKVKNYDIR